MPKLVQCPHCQTVFDAVEHSVVKHKLRQACDGTRTASGVAKLTDLPLSTVVATAKRLGLPLLPNTAKAIRRCEAANKNRFYPDYQRGRPCKRAAAVKIDGRWLCPQHAKNYLARTYGQPYRAQPGESCGALNVAPLTADDWNKFCSNVPTITVGEQHLCYEHAGAVLLARSVGLTSD